MPKPRVQSSSCLVGSDVTICTIRFVVVSPKNESQNAKIFHVWPSWRAELGVRLVWCHKRLLNRFLVSGNTSISKQSNASWRSSGGFFFPRTTQMTPLCWRPGWRTKIRLQGTFICCSHHQNPEGCFLRNNFINPTRVNWFEHLAYQHTELNKSNKNR